MPIITCTKPISREKAVSVRHMEVSRRRKGEEEPLLNEASEWLSAEAEIQLLKL